jgi:hypothetical protein
MAVENLELAKYHGQFEGNWICAWNPQKKESNKHYYSFIIACRRVTLCNLSVGLWDSS